MLQVYKDLGQVLETILDREFITNDQFRTDCKRRGELKHDVNRLGAPGVC